MFKEGNDKLELTNISLRYSVHDILYVVYNNDYLKHDVDESRLNSHSLHSPCYP